MAWRDVPLVDYEWMAARRRQEYAEDALRVRVEAEQELWGPLWVSLTRAATVDLDRATFSAYHAPLPTIGYGDIEACFAPRVPWWARALAWGIAFYCAVKR